MTHLAYDRLGFIQGELRGWLSVSVAVLVCNNPWSWWKIVVLFTNPKLCCHHALVFANLCIIVSANTSSTALCICHLLHVVTLPEDGQTGPKHVADDEYMVF